MKKSLPPLNIRLGHSMVYRLKNWLTYYSRESISRQRVVLGTARPTDWTVDTVH